MLAQAEQGNAVLRGAFAIHNLQFTIHYLLFTIYYS